MLKSNLIKFSEIFHSTIAADAHAVELLREHVFVETMGELLVDYGEMEDCVRCSYKAHGLKVDGYHFDDELSSLTLVVSHWLDRADLEDARVTDTEINAALKRCTNFVLRSMKGLHNKIEIANEAHDLSHLIYECRGDLQNVKIILITDGLAKDRPAEVEELEGTVFTRIIWDIERIRHFYQTGETETIDLNFSEDYGGPLPCLTSQNNGTKYTSYISFVSGSVLADIYERWGTKLLDMNVRVFLSARGKVNRGIRDTIRTEPEMFCAYNNGITTFAREIELVTLENGGLGISSAKGFQIVNGGQTTASLYHGRKKHRADLATISLQMKLNVIHEPDEIPVLVPKISEYSNTQNKIQMADLLANDPPHPELHAISTSTLAPDPTGGSKQTHWFYEKSRGSYEETKNMTALTPAQKKRYDSLYPKRQRFDKNKFGKAWNTYLMLPHIVSLGAQKNFVRFNIWLREQTDEDWTSFYRKTVALVLLWNRTESIVRKQDFVGYRHNIVTYTLAWLFKRTESKIDLEKIWESQEIGEPILEVIESTCHVVNDHIRATELNVTEWCKKEECWKNLLGHSITLPHSIESEFISADDGSKRYDPTLASDAETIEFCKSKDSEVWFGLSKWLKERGFLSGKARSQCFNMGRMLTQGRKPSIALSRACKKAWEDAVARGWAVEIINGDS
jgi:hypothetical protein